MEGVPCFFSASVLFPADHMCPCREIDWNGQSHTPPTGAKECAFSASGGRAAAQINVPAPTPRSYHLRRRRVPCFWPAILACTHDWLKQKFCFQLFHSVVICLTAFWATSLTCRSRRPLLSPATAISFIGLEVPAELRCFLGLLLVQSSSWCLACSKVTPTCKAGHWRTASGHVRQLLKLVEPTGALARRSSASWSLVCIFLYMYMFMYLSFLETYLF